jgi:hypothetical protein
VLKWLIDKAVLLYFRYQAQLASPNDRDLRQTDRRKFDYDSDGTPYRPTSVRGCDCGSPQCDGLPTDGDGHWPNGGF